MQCASHMFATRVTECVAMSGLKPLNYGRFLHGRWSDLYQHGKGGNVTGFLFAVGETIANIPRFGGT